MRMTCFWCQLPHNITVHTVRRSLKESCLKINVKKNFQLLLAASWQLIRSAGLVEAGESVCWCAGNLSNTHLAFALRKLPCSSVLMVTTQSSGHTSFRFGLPQANKIKKLIVNKGCVLKILCFSTLFVVSSRTFLSCCFLFVHEISSSLFFLLLFRRWPYSVPACFWIDCQLLLGLSWPWGSP